MKTIKHFTIILLLLVAAFGTKAQNPCGIQAYWYSSFNPNQVTIFHDTSTVSGAGWHVVAHQWSFGDGTTDTVAHPQHFYPNNGVYNVCEVVTAQLQGAAIYCKDTFCKTIYKGCTLNSLFTYSNNNGVIVANATSTGGSGAYLYRWLVDGTSWYPPNYTTSNSYTLQLAAGSHAVCLYSLDNTTQCKDTSCQTIVIAGTCNMQASIIRQYDSLTTNYTLTAISSGGKGSNTFYWNTQQTTKSIIVPSTIAKKYCVKITDSLGCYAYGCDSIIVPHACNLQGYFTFTNNGNVVVVQGNTNGGNGNFSYKWLVDYQTFYPTNYNPNSSYTLQLANGTHTICMYVKDNNTQCTDTFCKTITVSNSPTCSMYATIVSTYDSANNNFHLQAVNTGGKGKLNYNWSTQETTSDIYSNLNTSVYCVKVTDSVGCYAYACDTLVLPGTNCQAAFQYTMNCDTFKFSSNSSGGFTNYYWNFGDGDFATSANPTHVFAPGVWTVYLTVYNNGSCQNSYYNVITVQACNTTKKDTICGVLFEDTNGNGIQDSSEHGLSNQNVCVWIMNSTSICTLSDSFGHYQLIVPAGIYQIYANGPQGQITTIPVSLDSGYYALYDSIYIHGGTRHCGFDFGYQNTLTAISGTVFFDANNNHTQDPGETGVPYVSVKVGIHTTYTDANGNYYIQLPVGTYVVSYTPTGSYNGYAVSPISISVNANTVGMNYGNNNFGIYLATGTCNAEIILIPHTTVTPGFLAWYDIIVKNIGNTVLSGTANFYHDPSITFSSSSPVPTSYNANSIHWNYSNLLPGTSNWYWVEMDAATNIQINQSFLALANVTTNCNDD